MTESKELSSLIESFLNSDVHLWSRPIGDGKTLALRNVPGGSEWEVVVFDSAENVIERSQSFKSVQDARREYTEQYLKFIKNVMNGGVTTRSEHGNWATH